MAERTTILAYSILSAYVSGLPFSLAVRWTWGGGWLQELGFIDFAGGTVVHLVGGAMKIDTQTSISAGICLAAPEYKLTGVERAALLQSAGIDLSSQGMGS